jgi:hypothetical protein
MLVTYNGPNNTIRKLGSIVWSVQTGLTQEVKDPDLLENCLTYPGDQFSIDPGDPMVKAIGEDAAAMVGLSGVADLATLADLHDHEIEALAETAGVETEAAAGWVQSAREAKAAVDGL